MKQNVRIIGGKYRGKKLYFPEAPGLRPTPDRVRETLFNWLMHDIRGTRCLDAFAGSGALGFEAYSRGALKVTLIEQSPLVFANLCKNASAFNDPGISVVKADACTYLCESKEQFDIVFLDPPFARDYLPQCISLLAEKDILIANGLLYVESPVELELESKQWETVKLKRAGQVVYGLYRKC
ncbi:MULTISPECIES: 16S rRNA (guanine(966)-N(2))-methyltransferase RsmD [Legionella]|uniref:Ribosomal RNA small subunit methyltransferase D n=1 Tax=Legionella septentrionalis TaxID=2498109 RepID=A0A3S0X1I6_9GAMM|nr:16S rRNA (guanine(966)-N(2))-methyltransferase RsmD [Legionella septentrionalis]MCP0914588.1 16S rRNA (guanine(966)-N(2))-methyltransferase RsmD [Legionella sp. 27cVA30]RUQ90046.1 16S rRNA (guanine(966)-N(2))-methyltransferase RsmD [Legionella septentrionalis]RUQ96184.1 16S rRNA (guanine(966)-N(2))-methyltransferase RsmD [Legionella septentrionalis]RUR09338.1 16S rRNA (guanine(966)-N(2))-methyltransferase RsmD [Legionella septentrionalis]RUR14288.1 16S rRNA (guanine(966)-N(2))-methyltransfe